MFKMILLVQNNEKLTEEKNRQKLLIIIKNIVKKSNGIKPVNAVMANDVSEYISFCAGTLYSSRQKYHL